MCPQWHICRCTCTSNTASIMRSRCVCIKYRRCWKHSWCVNLLRKQQIFLNFQKIWFRLTKLTTILFAIMHNFIDIKNMITYLCVSFFITYYPFPSFFHTISKIFFQCFSVELPLFPLPPIVCYQTIFLLTLIVAMTFFVLCSIRINPLSANFTKWSNTLK